MHGVSRAQVIPRLLGSEDSDRCEQPTERIEDPEHRAILAKFLQPQLPDDVQAAAIARLGQIGDSASIFLAAWKQLGPAQRGQVLEVLLGRAEGTDAVLDALEKGVILPLDVDAVRRQRLTQHKTPAIKDRAVKLLAGASAPDRAKIVASYVAEVAAGKTAPDAARGAKVFVKSCAACHQFGGVGNAVGPDLNSLGDKSTNSLLVAIFDPNLAVEPRYLSYLAVTKAGLTIVGVIGGESSTTITMIAPDGTKHDLLRAEIDELVSTGKSLMPEGLEKDLPPVEVVDLLHYLRVQWGIAGNKNE